MNGQKFYLDISWITIFKIALVVFFLYLIYLIGDILIWVLFAVVISMLFNPVIDFLEERKVPRALSVVCLYGLAFGILGLAIYLTIPIFLQEAKQFSNFFQLYFERLSTPLRGLGIQASESMEVFVESLEANLTKMSANIFSAIFAIFGGLFSTFFVIVIGIFLSLEKRPLERAISLFSPQEYEKANIAIWRRSQKKVSGWFLSRVIACTFVGSASFLAFWLLKIEYPFSLAFIGGVLNFVPFIGPLLAGFLILLVGALENFFLSILAVLSYTIIQQIENNLISPVLTKKFVGLSPVLVLIALAIGGKLWGLLGAILTIPLLGALSEFIKDFLRMKKIKEKEKPLKEPPPPFEDKAPVIF